MTFRGGGGGGVPSVHSNDLTKILRVSGIRRWGGLGGTFCYFVFFFIRVGGGFSELELPLRKSQKKQESRHNLKGLKKPI